MLISTLCWAVSVATAGLLGLDFGRLSERKRLLSPVRRGSTERRRGDIEQHLISRLGLRPMHPDPDSAPRIVTLRVRR